MGGKPAAKPDRKEKQEMWLLKVLPVHFLTTVDVTCPEISLTKASNIYQVQQNVCQI
jgi:hypothetical protein